jgi:uncharacterized protein involved in tellurium resistance
LLWERERNKREGICKIKEYSNLDVFVSDIFLDRIEMYPDGRAELDNELHLGFKTRLEERSASK